MAQNIIFKVVADTKQFTAGMLTAKDEAGKVKQEIKNVKAETTELGKVMSGLESKIAGAFAIGSIIAFGKQVASIGAIFDNLTIRVNSLAGGVQEGELAMLSLQKMSKKLGIDLKVLTENYINFITAAKSSGMALTTAEKAFKSMNVAMAGAGVSAQTQTQVFNSLQMMIGKSSVSSMQLKQIFMAMPESIEVMAKTLGVSNKELQKMMKSGEVMAGDVLPEFAKNMEIALGGDAQKMAESMQGEINNLENAWDNLYKTAGNSGAVQAVISALTKTIGILENAVLGARAVFATFYALIDGGEYALRLEAELRQKALIEFQSDVRDMSERNAQAFINNEKKKGIAEKEIAKEMIKNAEYLEKKALDKIAVDDKDLRYKTQIKEEAKALRKYADELLATGKKQKELTDSELEAARKLAKEKEKIATAERIAKAELNVLNQVDDFDILIAKIDEVMVKRDEALKGVIKNSEQEKLITRKAEVEINKLQNDWADKTIKDAEDKKNKENAVTKEAYNEKIRELDYQRGVDLTSEEEYYQKKLELARQYGEDVRPIIVAQYAFEERLRKKDKQDEIDKTKKDLDDDEKLKAARIDTTYRTFETLGAINNAYTISQTNQLQEQLEKGIISQEQYEASLRKIRRRQAVLDKAGALFSIGIDTLKGVASASATVAGLPLVPLIKALGVASAGAVLATPIPYNKGTKRVPMTRGAIRGKDSVHAILTPEERVVPADINTQPGYSALMDLAHDRKISDKEAGVIARLATGGSMSSGSNESIDYNELGKSIAKYIPHTDVRIDHNGIAVITDRSRANMNRLKSRI